MIVDILLIKSLASLHMLNLNTASNLLLHQFSQMPKIDAVSKFLCILNLDLPNCISLNGMICVFFSSPDA